MAVFNFRTSPCGSGKVIFSKDNKDNDNFGNRQTFANPDTHKTGGRMDGWMAGMQTNPCI